MSGKGKVMSSNSHDSQSFFLCIRSLSPPLSINHGDVVYTKEQIRKNETYYPALTEGVIIETSNVVPFPYFDEINVSTTDTSEEKNYLVWLQSSIHSPQTQSSDNSIIQDCSYHGSILEIAEQKLIVEYDPIKHSQLCLVESFVKELPFLDFQRLKDTTLAEKVVVRRSQTEGGVIKEYANAFPMYAVIENVIAGFIAEQQRIAKCSLVDSDKSNTLSDETLFKFTFEFSITSGFFIDFAQLL